MKRRLAILWITGVPAIILFIAACRTDTAMSRPAPERVAHFAVSAININTATAARLESLPQIGKSRAAKIIEYRAKYGPFRRFEQLMLIDGISESLYLKIRDRIKTE